MTSTAFPHIISTASTELHDIPFHSRYVGIGLHASVHGTHRSARRPLETETLQFQIS